MELHGDNDKDDRKRTSLATLVLNIHSPIASKTVTCSIYYLTVASKNFKRQSIRIIFKKSRYRDHCSSSGAMPRPCLCLCLQKNQLDKEKLYGFISCITMFRNGVSEKSSIEESREAKAAIDKRWTSTIMSVQYKKNRQKPCLCYL